MINEKIGGEIMFYISLKTNYKLTLKQVKMINEITNELCQLFFEKNNCPCFADAILCYATV